MVQLTLKRFAMKPLAVSVLILICAGCADVPELDGSEPPSVKAAPYPRLIPLQDTLGPPLDPVNEATEVEDELTARSEALAAKARALQTAQTN